MNRVTYIIEDKECAQFRYRVDNIMELLTNSDYIVDYCFKNKIDDIDLDKIKLLIIERQTAKDGRVLRLIKRAKKIGVKVLFDIDDLVFNYSDAPLIKKTVREKSLLYWLGYIWGIRRIAKRVDGFICTNEFLAKKLKRCFGKPVKVIRNSLNSAQVEISERYVKEKEVREIAGSSFSIGYFSGSPTHKNDFAMIEPELIQFLTSHNDVKLKIVGYMKLSKQMHKLINNGRVETIKPVDYLRLQGLMAKVDVNIAPLVINDFTNCKSELKFFEAASVETTTIASPTYSFKKAIKDGENGFLAQPGEWYKKIEYLYKHPEENKTIAKNAREYALKHYYGREFLKEVEATYDYFAK